MILIVKNDYMDIYTQSIYSLYTVYIQSIYSLYTAYSLHNKSVINKKLKK